jgi:L-threonylcarbamoyladenylate synthase
MTEVARHVLEEAVTVIKQGGVVAFPTETYYGLAVDPFQEKALERIFIIKKRSFNKAILTLVDSRQTLFRLTAGIDPVYEPLMDYFWPGPVTLLFSGKEGLSPLLTGNTASIGSRISSHPTARKLCGMIGQPITATSANLSGERAAISAREVGRQLGSGVDLIINGGKTCGGQGSTIVAAHGTSLKLIRRGKVPFKALLEVVRAYTF